jgi:hypothetical protein
LPLCRVFTIICIYIYIYISMAQQFLVCQGLLIIEASRSDLRHTTLGRSDHPDTENCTWQHTTLTREKHPCSRQDSNPQSHHAAAADRRLRPPHYRGFTITLRHTTVGRTPLNEGSARRRDLYMTTHNTHKRQTSMPPAGFKPAVPQASSRRPTP